MIPSNRACRDRIAALKSPSQTYTARLGTAKTVSEVGQVLSLAQRVTVVGLGSTQVGHAAARRPQTSHRAV